MEHTPDVSPHVGTSQMHAQDKDEQREVSHPRIGINIVLQKPRRIIRQLERYGFGETMSYALVATNRGSKTYEEVVASLDSSRWVQAMAREPKASFSRG